MENYGRGVDVNVTISPTGSPPTGKTIHMYESNQKNWIALYDWLCQFVAKRYSSLPRYSIQHALWKCTGKSFPLFELPSELRAKIYTHVLGHELYPLSNVYYLQWDNFEARKNARLSVGGGYNREAPSKHRNLISNYTLPEARKHIYEPNFALIQVSK